MATIAVTEVKTVTFTVDLSLEEARAIRADLKQGTEPGAFDFYQKLGEALAKVG